MPCLPKPSQSLIQLTSEQPNAEASQPPVESPKFYIASPKPQKDSPSSVKRTDDHFSFQASQEAEKETNQKTSIISPQVSDKDDEDSDSDF